MAETDFTNAVDGAVARAIAAGSGDAEAVLVARFSRRVFLYGVRHLGSEAAADDLAQDVMATVLEKLRAGEVREPDRIGSFILGTARWLTRDQRRRERRAAQVAVAAAREQDDSITSTPTVDADRLASALAELGERERAVVVLSFVHGRSAGEIGDVFGLRPGHVRVIRHRAIAKLAEILGVRELADAAEAS